MENVILDINNITNPRLLKVLKEWEEISEKDVIPIINKDIPQLLKEGWEAEILNKRK